MIGLTNVLSSGGGYYARGSESMNYVKFKNKPTAELIEKYASGFQIGTATFTIYFSSNASSNEDATKEFPVYVCGSHSNCVETDDFSKVSDQKLSYASEKNSASYYRSAVINITTNSNWEGFAYVALYASIYPQSDSWNYKELGTLILEPGKTYTFSSSETRSSSNIYTCVGFRLHDHNIKNIEEI